MLVIKTSIVPLVSPFVALLLFPVPKAIMPENNGYIYIFFLAEFLDG